MKNFRPLVCHLQFKVKKYTCVHHVPTYNPFTYSESTVEHHHRCSNANVWRVENCSNLPLRKNKTPSEGRNNLMESPDQLHNKHIFDLH